MERTAKRKKIAQFLDGLKCHGALLTEFDEKLWLATVESVTVYSEREVTVRFKDGNEVTAEV